MKHPVIVETKKIPGHEPEARSSVERILFRFVPPRQHLMDLSLALSILLRTLIIVAQQSQSAPARLPYGRT